MTPTPPLPYDADDPAFALHVGGKLETVGTVPLRDADDLSLAYTPGVARVCTAIADHPELADDLTWRSHVVADEHNLVIPDVVVTTAEAAARGGLGLAPADLLLVVEVLSPSTRRVDLTLKRDTYSSWGVPYWVVDPEGEDVVRHGHTPSWAERLTGDDIFPTR